METETDLITRRREEIIEAALKVVSEKGYHAAKIEDIAAELKIGHGTFYRYFKSKLDVFNHVVEYVMQMVVELVADIDPREADSLDEYRAQLEKIGDYMFELFKKNPQIARVLFYEAFGIDDDTIKARIKEIFDAFGSYTELYLKNGMEKGYLRKDLHTRETALAINAALFEACRRVVSEKNPEKMLKIWKETIISLMLQGIRA
jgi:AcrR family transcriptional regulator